MSITRIAILLGPPTPCPSRKSSIRVLAFRKECKGLEALFGAQQHQRRSYEKTGNCALILYKTNG